MEDAFFPSRRLALKYLGGAASGAMLLGWHGRLAANAAGKPGLWAGREPGLGLYTLGQEPSKNLVGAFKAVAALGYRVVELFDNYGQTAAQLRKALDAAGLHCPSVIVLPEPTSGMKAAWDLDDTSKLAANLTAIGASFAAVAGPKMPKGKKDVVTFTADDWKATADFLNEKAAALVRSGLRLAYHNHNVEFLPLADGTTGYQVLLERTDPKLVYFEVDIGWATTARQSLRELFDRLGTRVRLLHMKDTKRASPKPYDLETADVGQGIVDWKELATLVRSSQVEQMYVEEEEPFPKTRMDSARVAYEYLTKTFR